jgi:hypothetical protein
MDLLQQDNYTHVLQTLKDRVQQAQYQAFKAVNTELIQLYWDIGKTIVAQQEQAGWGKSIVAHVGFEVQSIEGIRSAAQIGKASPRRGDIDATVSIGRVAR